MHQLGPTTRCVLPLCEYDGRYRSTRFLLHTTFWAERYPPCQITLTLLLTTAGMQCLEHGRFLCLIMTMFDVTHNSVLGIILDVHRDSLCIKSNRTLSLCMSVTRKLQLHARATAARYVETHLSVELDVPTDWQSTCLSIHAAANRQQIRPSWAYD